MTDQRIEKWRHRMEKGVANDVFTMHLQRFAWVRLHEMVEANDRLQGTESYFWEFLFNVYTKDQASAVRRQTEAHDEDVASLARVIFEMKETPTLLTREWWVGLWTGDDGNDPHWRQRAEAGFASQFGGEVGDHLDPSIPEADLAALLDGSKKVRDYVDMHVAHFDARTIRRDGGPPEPELEDAPTRKGAELPTLDDVHNTIDLIGRLFVKYENLLTAATWAELTPALQHNWEAIFETPWKPPEDDD
jgi:hypothetical protein